jgi:hypothetical protein
VVGTFKVVVRWSSTKPSGKLGRHGYMLPCSCDVSEGGCLGGLRRNLSIPEAKALIQSLAPISGTMSERLTSQSLTHGLGFRGVTFATGGGRRRVPRLQGLYRGSVHDRCTRSVQAFGPVGRLPMTEDGNTGLDSRLPLCLSLHSQKSSWPGLGSAKTWKNSARRSELIRRCGITRTEGKRAAQSALHRNPHQRRELQRDHS